MLCFILLLCCRHSANVFPRISFMKWFRAQWRCFRVERRLLVCPLRLSFDVNSWMHYFNWTPTMGDSYLLQASYWSVIVELCSDWRNDKEIIFFGPSVFTLRKNPSLFSCIWFFFQPHASHSLSNASLNRRNPRICPLFFYSLLNTNQIVLLTRQFQSISIVALLSIDLFYFFLTFSHREISTPPIVACVPSATRSFDRWRNFASARLDSSDCCDEDSMASTLCKHIKRPNILFANKDEK